MNIRTKLTFLFAVIVSVILIFFSLIIYYTSADFRENEFYGRLEDRAMTSVKLLIDVDQVDKDLLKIIDKNIVGLIQEEIKIFDENLELIYSSADSDVSEIYKEKLIAIQENEKHEFVVGIKEAIGVTYTVNGKNYYVVAMAFDKFGLRKLNYLKSTLILGNIISVIITILSGLIYVNRALKPIAEINEQAKIISGTDLKKRLDVVNEKDEIGKLAVTINDLLSRIEETFDIQDSFISNVSHELRTPLTTISVQLEAFLMKKRNIEEYETLLSSFQTDVANLITLTNGLLQLSQFHKNQSNLKLEKIRIDEIIYDAKTDLLRQNENYTIEFDFGQLPNDDKNLIILGNHNLLKVVFINLMDNGCKFSETKKTVIKLSFVSKSVIVSFIDSGIGIPEVDIVHLNKLFFRASNAANIKGFGIGLSLVKRIIELHKAKIEIFSEQNKGTIIKLTFDISGN